MSKDLSKTVVFSSEDIKSVSIKNSLSIVYEALKERGYNPVHQIVGYLISNDPAYISSHKNARAIIQKIDRDDIIEELVKAYLDD